MVKNRFICLCSNHTFGNTANLVQLGTSMITSGHQQDLKLDPGTYSINPDENTFDTSVSFDLFTKNENLFFFNLELDL